MTTELEILLDHIGYAARPQQTKLYELLTEVNHDGVVVQAGTGTGKSIAVLAAAAHAFRETGRQSLIVTPTRVLMDQYLAKDVPAAREAFGLSICELRGKRWYDCELSDQVRGGRMVDQNEVAQGESVVKAGCLGSDGGCSYTKWKQSRGYEEPGTRADGEQFEKPDEWYCEYQQAKWDAQGAAIVVTNTDMWIVSDRMGLGFFDPLGAVFVDEAHQLEPKMKDYAGRSVQAKELTRYYGDRRNDPGAALAKYLRKWEGQQPTLVDGRIQELLQVCWNSFDGDTDKTTERQKEVQEGIGKMLERLETPSDNCLIWTDGKGIKMDFIDVSGAAGELLTARPFGLVSATIPSTMRAALGVPQAVLEDVGHPFDYSTQATVSISRADGAYKYAGAQANFDLRLEELRERVHATPGGALLLFSSFKDMERVFEVLAPELRASGRTVLRQNDEVNPMANDELGELFKRSRRGVLFGSESFATGFDAPGDALTLVSIWKLPYPGKDPVTDALMRRFYPRYLDLMLTRVVQAAGRLIRTTDDTGHLHIADSRAVQKVLQSNDLMVRHLGDFRRV